MNLTRVLKDKRVKFIFLVIIIASGILIYFQLATKKLELQVAPLAYPEVYKKVADEIATNSIAPQNLTISDSFEFDPPLISQAPVYKYQTAKLEDGQIEKIISTLGVNVKEIYTSSEDVGEIILADQGNKSLTIYKDMGVVIYSNRIASQDSQTFDATFDIDLYRQKAREFIESLGFSSAQYESLNYAFIGGASYEPEIVNSPSRASSVQFTFESKINGINLIDSKSSLLPNTITVWIDRDFSISRLNLQITGTVLENLSTVSIMSEKEVLDSLQNGDYILKHVNLLTGEVSQIIAQKGYLSYYAVEDKLIPIIVIQADVISPDRERGFGFLYVKEVER